MADIALLTIFPALMAYAAASDLVTMTIPNRLSLALIAAFAAFALAAGLPWGAILTHVAAGALVLAVCFGLFAFRWIGGGGGQPSPPAPARARVGPLAGPVVPFDFRRRGFSPVCHLPSRPP